MDISQEARFISQTYENALKSAENLLERDAGALKDQLQDAKDKTNQVMTEREQLRADIHEMSEEADAYRCDVRIVVETLRPVVQAAFHFPQHYSHAQLRNALQILQDYPPTGEEARTPYIRLPQQAFFQTASELRDARESVQSLREVAHDQQRLIQEHSAKLDKEANRYQECVRTVKEREHEILLLDQRNQDLEGKVEEYQSALRLADQNRLHEDNEVLKRELNRVSHHFDKRLEAKDKSLLQLRQELDRTRKRLTASLVELENVKVLHSWELQNTFCKRRGLPSSHSSFSLGINQPQSETSRIQHNYKNLRKLQTSRPAAFASAMSPSTSDPIHTRTLSDPFRDSPYKFSTTVTRSNADSATIRSDNNAKPLPSPPIILPRIRPAATLGEAESELAETVTMSPRRFHLRDVNEQCTPATGRRMLSLIAESSLEDSDSARTSSTTSSDREAYRKSLDALEVLNVQDQGER